MKDDWFKSKPNNEKKEEKKAGNNTNNKKKVELKKDFKIEIK
jgi:hypothetical protein